MGRNCKNERVKSVYSGHHYNDMSKFLNHFIIQLVIRLACLFAIPRLPHTLVSSRNKMLFFESNSIPNGYLQVYDSTSEHFTVLKELPKSFNFEILDLELLELF